MHRYAKIVPNVLLAAVWLLAAPALAQTATAPATRSAPAADATAAPAPETSAPAAADAAAPQAPAPVPPGYAYPPPYYPPPGSGPPPGYYPPPGYPYAGYYPVQPAAPPPGFHEHDGFYMRLAMGAGYLHTKASYSGQSQTISGGALGLNFAFGGSVTPNLVVFGELSALSAPDPTVEYGGSSRTANGTSVDLIGFGPGIAYYFVPLNLYLSGAINFSQVTASNNSSNSTNSNDSVDLTEVGFGMSFVVGKEWWVSANWGLGVAGMFQWASMKLKNDDSRMSATGFSILFSATYN